MMKRNLKDLTRVDCLEVFFKDFPENVREELKEYVLGVLEDLEKEKG